MATKVKKHSLADKIHDLITVAPKNFGSDDEADETKAKVVEQFNEFESDDDRAFNTSSSSIRKKNIDLLDEIDDRYRGKKVSKKDIYGSDSSDNDEDEDDDNDDGEFGESEDEVEENDIDDDYDEEEDGEEENESYDENEGSDSDDVDDENPLYRNRKDDKNFKHMTVNNPRDDVEKGNCVREQLKIWENLLEMRIQFQKCLASSNKLPQFDVHKEYVPHEEFSKGKNQITNKLMDLLDNMLEVQDKLLKNNPETKNLLVKKENKNNDESESIENDPMDEEICSDTEDEMEKVEENNEKSSTTNEQSDEPPKKKRKTLKEYEKILKYNHEKYTPYRNSMIQLWNDKTRVASGNINKGTNQSIVKQIEFILNDKMKVIRKTQLKRSEYEVIGKKNKNETTDNERGNKEYDPEIYDDDDFYHQLLRELIQHKSADITDPVQLSKQWIQLQNMRNKMKRKINTKETKGRRIRYGQIHNKLVNFMAPITINDTWSSETKNNLYKTLFGKIKSSDNELITNNKNVVNNE
ncbi:hypothetical protein PV327_003549 [Microctonus hyperodae]|uniref:Protein AATF n=1 Tax=Microctonus hyperodae TaxID=165561 RepID=A0AA39G553_MICHY|nr:hypothetical protein PV327_003549 [Microctonus hyperodae]